MNKMNKKGFTLIEMLVVIAIIAILVSIIVPVVGNSSKKAAAAANAANLRSAAASIAIELLENKEGKFDSLEDGDEITGFTLTPPVARTNGGINGGTFKAVYDGGEVVCSFDDNDIDYYADIADDGEDNDSNKGKTETPNA